MLTSATSGSRSQIASASESCLESENPGDVSMSPDDEEPPMGTGYYYLVRASNACADGTYGDGSENPDPRDLLDLSTPAEYQ